MKYLLLPRLSRGQALALRDELRVAVQRGESLEKKVAFAHPRAVAVATGGTRARPEDLQQVRQRVLERLEPFRVGTPNAAFDSALGRALAEEVPVSPSDAGHPETWNFLTLGVFPDLLYRRFPDMQDERALGGERNVLQRVWVRQSALGELTSSQEAPLLEDEYVQLFERSALARIPGLIRACAEVILDARLPNRPDAFTRRLLKRVVWKTGSLDLGVLDPAEMRAVVAAEASVVRRELGLEA